jgi:hypothetical protein
MNMRHYPPLNISKKRNNICLSIDIVSEEFEDTKEVISIRISKKNRQVYTSWYIGALR